MIACKTTKDVAAAAAGKQPTSTLTESLELLLVASEPGSLPGSSLASIGTVSRLADSASLASGRSESPHFAVLVYGVDDPVDAGVIADLGVGGIDADDFVVFHGGVLVDPVRVQDTKVGVPASGLFFGNRLQVALELEVVDTLMLGLTKDHTTVVLSLSSSTTDTGTDDNVSLLGFVTEAVSLVGTGGAVDSDNVVALTVFPSADTQQESEGIRLLVTPKLFHVFVGTHLELYFEFLELVKWKVCYGEMMYLLVVATSMIQSKSSTRRGS